MKKKVLYLFKTAIAMAFIFSLFISVKVNLSSSKINERNKQIAVAQETSGEVCSRIKQWCSCMDGNVFIQVSITECEEYIWQIPMKKEYCQTTECPPDSSC